MREAYPAGRERGATSSLGWRETSKADFSDALIAECAVAAGCKPAVMFERTAAATSGFELLT
jgi:predicted nucleic-acid-binding protein